MTLAAIGKEQILFLDNLKCFQGALTLPAVLPLTFSAAARQFLSALPVQLILQLDLCLISEVFLFSNDVVGRVDRGMA